MTHPPIDRWAPPMMGASPKYGLPESEALLEDQADGEGGEGRYEGKADMETKEGGSETLRQAGAGREIIQEEKRRRKAERATNITRHWWGLI